MQRGACCTLQCKGIPAKWERAGRVPLTLLQRSTELVQLAVKQSCLFQSLAVWTAHATSIVPTSSLKEGLGNTILLLSAALLTQATQGQAVAVLIYRRGERKRRGSTSSRSTFAGTVTAEPDYHPGRVISLLTLDSLGFLHLVSRAYFLLTYKPKRVLLKFSIARS